MEDAPRPNRSIVFRGNPTPILKSICAVVFPLFLIMSVPVVGRLWYRMFLFLSVTLGSSGLCLIWVLFRWSEWFYLDDIRKRVVGVLRQTIPYEKIEAIRIVRVGGYIAVNARIGPGRREQVGLVGSLDPRQESRLEQELFKRFPDKIAYEQYPRSRERALIGLMPVLIFGVACALYVYVFLTLDLYPWTQTVPQKLIWRSVSTTSQQALEHRLGGFSFQLPKDFEKTGQYERTLILREPGQKLKFKATCSSDISPPSSLRKPLWRYGTGLRNEYEFLHAVYNARLGLIFLISKLLQLGHLWDPSVYEIEQNGFKGFMVRGTRRGYDITEIVLFDLEEEKALRFIISSLKPTDDAFLATIIRSVERSD